MKVLMFNGSPKAKGCTYTALEEMAKVLNEEGIETEIMHVGAHPQGSCMYRQHRRSYLRYHR